MKAIIQSITKTQNGQVQIIVIFTDGVFTSDPQIIFADTPDINSLTKQLQYTAGRIKESFNFANTLTPAQEIDLANPTEDPFLVAKGKFQSKYNQLQSLANALASGLTNVQSDFDTLQKEVNNDYQSGFLL